MPDIPSQYMSEPRHQRLCVNVWIAFVVGPRGSRQRLTGWESSASYVNFWDVERRDATQWRSASPGKGSRLRCCTRFRGHALWNHTGGYFGAGGECQRGPTEAGVRPVSPSAITAVAGGQAALQEARPGEGNFLHASGFSGSSGRRGCSNTRVPCEAQLGAHSSGLRPGRPVTVPVGTCFWGSVRVSCSKINPFGFHYSIQHDGRVIDVIIVNLTPVFFI